MNREEYIEYRKTKTLTPVAYDYFLNNSKISLNYEEFFILFTKFSLNYKVKKEFIDLKGIKRVSLLPVDLNFLFGYYDRKFGIVLVYKDENLINIL